MIELPPIALTVWLVSLSGAPPDAINLKTVNDALVAGASVRLERGAGYVTVRPGCAQASKVRIIRGNQVIVVNPRRIRSNPGQDVKVQPGDIIEPVETFF